MKLPELDSYLGGAKDVERLAGADSVTVVIEVEDGDCSVRIVLSKGLC